MLWSTTRVARLLSCGLGMAIPTSEGAETPEEGASGGSLEGSVDELVMVRESVRLGPFHRDHRGMGEAPPWIYLVCDDHS